MSCHDAGAADRAATAWPLPRTVTATIVARKSAAIRLRFGLIAVALRAEVMAYGAHIRLLFRPGRVKGHLPAA